MSTRTHYCLCTFLLLNLIFLFSCNDDNSVIEAPTDSKTTDEDSSDKKSDTCTSDQSLSFKNIECDMEPSKTSKYTETVSGDVRKMVVNSYPNHKYYSKTSFKPSEKTFTVDATPSKAKSVTPIISNAGRPRIFYGLALNGIIMAPAPAEPFIFENTRTGEYNWDWVFEPTNNKGSGKNLVALDCASAHTGPQGYHYHGNMYEYAETLKSGLSNGTEPSEPIQMGWAADGFPVLYLYGPDASGKLKALKPSYQLKSGDRPGDGIAEPCGTYNGKYTNDYKYVSGLGDLDECNGVERSITLTTAQGEETFLYFYVITEDFPQIGRCLSGTPDSSFY